MENRINKFAICLLSLVCLAEISFAIDNKPVINMEPRMKIDYEVELSSSMKKALKEKNSDFKIWKRVNFASQVTSEYKYTAYQSPSAVFGDFNGDNIIDVVLMGYGKIQQHIIAIVSNVPKSKLQDSKSMHYDQMVIDPYAMSSFPPKKETVMEKYKAVEIWLGNGFSRPPESTRNIKLSLIFHPKGEIIKGDIKKYPDACNEVLKNDAFAVKNFDIDGLETLFPCEKYMVVSCVIRK